MWPVPEMAAPRAETQDMLSGKPPWIMDCPLKTAYPNIYRICNNQQITIAEARRNNWNFGPIEGGEWLELIERLVSNFIRDTGQSNVDIVNHQEVHCQITLQIYYLWRMIDFRTQKLWPTKVPLKIQIFLCILWHNRLQMAYQLRIMKWDGSNLCKLCGKEELAQINFLSDAL